VQVSAAELHRQAFLTEIKAAPPLATDQAPTPLGDRIKEARHLHADGPDRLGSRLDVQVDFLEETATELTMQVHG
jgi:hypothetical protein